MTDIPRDFSPESMFRSPGRGIKILRGLISEKQLWLPLKKEDAAYVAELYFEGVREAVYKDISQQFPNIVIEDYFVGHSVRELADMLEKSGSLDAIDSLICESAKRPIAKKGHYSLNKCFRNAEEHSVRTGKDLEECICNMHGTLRACAQGGICSKLFLEYGMIPGQWLMDSKIISQKAVEITDRFIREFRAFVRETLLVDFGLEEVDIYTGYTRAIIIDKVKAVSTDAMSEGVDRTLRFYKATKWINF